MTYEQKQTLERLNCKSTAMLKKYDGYIFEMEKVLKQLSEQGSQYSAEIDQALLEFAEVLDSIESVDEIALIGEHLAIRPKKNSKFDEYVKSYEPKETARLIHSVKHNTDNSLLHEDLENERKSLLWEKTCKALRRRHKQPDLHPRKQKSHDDEWER